MLSNARVTAVVAVKDIDKGREFYGGKLGLDTAEEEPGGIIYACGGGTRLLVYTSSYAGTNEATAISWEVDDIGAEVTELKAKGISFEHYDLPGMTREDDVHVMGNIRGAWFKDPDGNILSLVTRGA